MGHKIIVAVIVCLFAVGAAIAQDDIPLEQIPAFQFDRSLLESNVIDDLVANPRGPDEPLPYCCTVSGDCDCTGASDCVQMSFHARCTEGTLTCNFFGCECNRPTGTGPTPGQEEC